MHHANEESGSFFQKKSADNLIRYIVAVLYIRKIILRGCGLVVDLLISRGGGSGKKERKKVDARE